MAISTRYIFWKLLRGFATVTVTLICVVWLTQSLRFIDYIVNRGLPVSGFLEITALVLPSSLVIVLPIALFATTLFIYRQLSLDSELVVFNALGRSRIDMARPALYLGFLVAMLGLAIQLYVMPAGYRQFKDLQSSIRENFASVVLEAGTFNEIMSGVTIYARERDDKGEMHGVILHDSRKKAAVATMMASTGGIYKTDEGLRAVLLNGSRQTRDPQTGQLSILDFDRYSIDLNQFIQTSGPRFREGRERYLHELLDPGTGSDAENNKPNFLAEAHARLASPLWTLAMTLIACSSAMLGQFNRRGANKRLLAAVVAGILVQILGAGLPQLAAQYAILNIVQYVLPAAVFVGIMIALGNFSRHHKEAVA